jgi:hypothetical protein
MNTKSKVAGIVIGPGVFTYRLFYIPFKKPSGLEGNIMGSVFRDVEDGILIMRVRERHYVEDKVWNSLDTKEWFDVTVPKEKEDEDSLQNMWDFVERMAVDFDSEAEWVEMNCEAVDEAAAKNIEACSFMDSRTIPNDKLCPDCKAIPGDEHQYGCDIERCADCGRKANSCGCVTKKFSRLRWEGEAHFMDAIEAYQLWAVGPPWVPFPPGTPNCVPDFNTLYGGDFVWNPEKVRWDRS